MNNFKGGFKGGDRKFGGKKKFGGDKKYDGGQRSDNRNGGGGGSEMFSATCSECQKKCDVPFKPSQDKPVYCSACFGMKKSGNELRGDSNGGKRERKPFGNGQVNNGPAFSSAPAGPTAQNILELKQQVSALEVKLNKILDLLNPPKPAVKAAATVVEAPATKEKKVAPKKATKTVVKKAVVKKVAKKATPKKLPAVKVPAKKVAAKAPVKKTAKKATPKKATKK